MSRRLLALPMVVALLCGVVTGARADDDLRGRKGSVDRALAAQHDDLEEASVAVRRAAAALSAVAVELPRAQRRLAVAEGQFAGARARAVAAQAGLDAATVAVTSAEQARTASRRRLTTARRDLGELARAAYMLGPQTYLAVVLQAETPTELVARRERVRAVLREADSRVQEMGQARADLANRAAAFELGRDRMARRQRDAAAALARVRSLADAARDARSEVLRQVAARRSALAVAERERAADLRRYRALQAESRHLAELIRRTSRGPGRVVGVRGMLWPTPGPVTSGYGYRVHPIYGYRRFHAGVDIGAPAGQGVVSALGGVVVHAGPLGGYGNLVVVDHGGGLATAYAHLSQVLVGTGRRVARGALVGRVGSTGASTGPHLHFEVRVDGEPVDPMRYY